MKRSELRKMIQEELKSSMTENYQHDEITHGLSGRGTPKLKVRTEGAESKWIDIKPNQAKKLADIFK